MVIVLCALRCIGFILHVNVALPIKNLDRIVQHSSPVYIEAFVVADRREEQRN